MPLAPQPFTPRQEMRGSEFEIQYKRDSDLQSVDLHHHDFYELYFLISGDVTYTIESGLCRVFPGNMLLIAPQELHQVYIRPERGIYERYMLWISPKIIGGYSTPDCDLSEALDPARPGYGNQLRLSAEEQTRIHSLLHQLYEEANQPDYGSKLLQESLLKEILVMINRLARQGASHQEAAYESSQLISRVIDYVNLHCAEALSLDLLADIFFVSKYHLSHEFQRQMGTSIYRYIQKKRLLMARQLLQEGQRPGQVYGACGYGDYANFFRAFKAEYGVSPRAFLSALFQNS